MRRRWIAAATSSFRLAPVARIRIVTYNILADALCMTEKHSYCAAVDREWGDASRGRCSRLLSELMTYDAEVLCLQECSLKCFEQFTEALLGYTGFHHSSFLKSDDAAVARESETGLAIFVKSAAWHTAHVKAARLGSLEDAQRHTGRLRQKLSSQSDAILMVRLQHEQSGATVALGNTHLHWDPRWPHLKAAQGELAARALASFGFGKITQASLVLCGDFNSVPVLQPAFLSEAQRQALPDPLPEAWRASGLYGLLSTGRLPVEHPEHPSTFGRGAPDGGGDASAAASGEQEKLPAADEEGGGEGGGGGPPAAKKQKKRHKPLGPLCTPAPWRDALAEALGAGPLPLTTHADDFKGGIDYVWVDHSLSVLEALEMPYDVQHADAFGQIPSAEWPSDHLALGVVLGVTAREEQA